MSTRLPPLRRTFLAAQPRPLPLNLRSSSVPRFRSPSRSSLFSSSSTTSSSSARQISTKTALTLASLLAITTYTLGAIFPPPPFTILFPRPAPPPPSDPDSKESKEYIEDLEKRLQSLKNVREHRESPPPPSSPSSPPSGSSSSPLPSSTEWYETRPYTNYPEERRVNNLTAGALRGPGKLALPPLVRARKDETEAYVWVHLGRGLCGHDGIVHGGLLATLLDETLARQAISNLPDKVGVTASLTINYKAPTRADQFIVIKTKLLEAKGRKARVSGTVEDLDGNILAEASATFVQPRYAKLLKSEALKHAMGEPSHSQEPVLIADGEKLKGPHHPTENTNS